MSNIGRYVHERHENAAHYWQAMDTARGKSLSDFTPEEINSMVWSARLWLRGFTWKGKHYLDQVLLTADARAEITRRAMEAEQFADYKEL